MAKWCGSKQVSPHPRNKEGMLRNPAIPPKPVTRPPPPRPSEEPLFELDDPLSKKCACGRLTLGGAQCVECVECEVGR